MNVTWKPIWINKTITKFLLELHCVKKCPYLECFWSVFSCIRPEHGGRLANWKRHEVKYWENIPLFVQLRFFTLLLHFWQFDIRKKLKWSFKQLALKFQFLSFRKKMKMLRRLQINLSLKDGPQLLILLLYELFEQIIYYYSPWNHQHQKTIGFDRFRGNRSYSIRLNLANIGENP